MVALLPGARPPLAFSLIDSANFMAVAAAVGGRYDEFSGARTSGPERVGVAAEMASKVRADNRHDVGLVARWSSLLIVVVGGADSAVAGGGFTPGQRGARAEPLIRSLPL